jgi:hypothetical protein
MGSDHAGGMRVDALRLPLWLHVLVEGKAAQAAQLSGSLSDLGLIYCGKAGFGQIFRSFSLNSYGYSLPTIGKSAANRLFLTNNCLSPTGS